MHWTQPASITKRDRTRPLMFRPEVANPSAKRSKAEVVMIYLITVALPLPGWRRLLRRYTGPPDTGSDVDPLHYERPRSPWWRHNGRPRRAGAQPGHRTVAGRATVSAQNGGDLQQELIERSRCRPETRTAGASRTVNRGRLGEASHGPLRGRRPEICYEHPAAPAIRRRSGERYARRRRACGRSSRR